MTGLLDVPPEWVTLRSRTPEGLPVVVTLDRAVVTGAPYDVFTTQVAIALPLGSTRDGQPAQSDLDDLRTLEQGMVDAAQGQGRLVAVMTLEGVREWMLYARDADWALPFVEAGLSVQVGADPTFHGLRELAGVLPD